MEDREVALEILTQSIIKVVTFNAILFMGSIGAWVYIMYDTSKNRRVTVAATARYRLHGCPTINGGIRWAVWVPGEFHETALRCSTLTSFF